MAPTIKRLSRRRILTTCEASLKRLKIEAIDFDQTQMPDPVTPSDKSLRAFGDLVRTGKVRHVGYPQLCLMGLAPALGASERAEIACDSVTLVDPFPRRPASR